MSEILKWVDGRCVTPDEFEEVAAWCHSDTGMVNDNRKSKEAQRCIYVGNDIAVVGDWIVTDGLHFARVTDAEYKKSFEAAMRNRKKFIQVLELVSDAIVAGAPHHIHGVGVDKNIVAEQATLQIMKLL